MAAGNRTTRIVCALLIVFSTAGCGNDGPTSPSAQNTTQLAVISSPGDVVGNGFTQRVGLDDGIFAATLWGINGNRQSLEVAISPKTPGAWSSWSMRFATPVGETLRPGTYDGITSWPGQNGQAGFTFSSGLVCNHTSRVVITEAVVAAGNPLTGVSVERLKLSFEMRCAGATAPFKGELTILANPWR